jgi:hypothetical protein
VGRQTAQLLQARSLTVHLNALAGYLVHLDLLLRGAGIVDAELAVEVLLSMIDALSPDIGTKPAHPSHLVATPLYTYR